MGYPTPPRTPRKRPVGWHAPLVLADSLIRSGARAAKRIKQAHNVYKTVTKIAKPIPAPRTHVRTLGHGKVPGTKKKIKSIKRKPAGVSDAFAKKVTKVTSFKKAYGLHRYIGDIQLRQSVLDQYSVQNTDKRDQPWDLFTPKQIWDAHDVLFEGKVQNASPTNTLNTTKCDGEIQTISQSCTFFFKSTSSHVVNVEMFIGTRKSNSGNSTKDLEDAFVDALDDFVNLGASHAGFASWDLTTLGFSGSFLPTALQDWSVEKRTFKIPPGHTHTETVQGPRNKKYDGVKMVKEGVNATTSNNGDDFHRYIKGSKNVFFRIINDVTVSTTTASPDPKTGAQAGDIHHWPSNNIGGVALSYQRDIRLVPINEDEKNTLCISNWRQAVGDAADQQVTVEAPANDHD